MANGVRLGCTRTLTHHQQRKAIKRLKAGKETLGEIARSYGTLDIARWEQSNMMSFTTYSAGSFEPGYLSHLRYV